MTMQPKVLDVYAILETTAGAPPEKVMRVRNSLRDLLRAYEEMHDLPRSFLTKVERGEAPPKQGHHNR